MVSWLSWLVWQPLVEFKNEPQLTQFPVTSVIPLVSASAKNAMAISVSISFSKLDF